MKGNHGELTQFIDLQVELLTKANPDFANLPEGEQKFTAVVGSKGVSQNLVLNQAEQSFSLDQFKVIKKEVGDYNVSDMKRLKQVNYTGKLSRSTYGAGPIPKGSLNATASYEVIQSIKTRYGLSYEEYQNAISTVEEAIMVLQRFAEDIARLNQLEFTDIVEDSVLENGVFEYPKFNLVNIQSGLTDVFAGKLLGLTQLIVSSRTFDKLMNLEGSNRLVFQNSMDSSNTMSPGARTMVLLGRYEVIELSTLVDYDDMSTIYVADGYIADYTVGNMTNTGLTHDNAYDMYSGLIRMPRLFAPLPGRKVYALNFKLEKEEIALAKERKESLILEREASLKSLFEEDVIVEGE